MRPREGIFYKHCDRIGIFFLNIALFFQFHQSRTCDQQVAGSNPGRRAAKCNPGQVVYTYVHLAVMLGDW